MKRQKLYRKSNVALQKKHSFPDYLKDDLKVNDFFPVEAESLEGVVTSASLRSIPDIKTNAVESRLELRLQGRDECFYINGAGYRVDVGDRVVLYTQPAYISNAELQAFLVKILAAREREVYDEFGLRKPDFGKKPDYSKLIEKKLEEDKFFISYNKKKSLFEEEKPKINLSEFPFKEKGGGLKGKPIDYSQLMGVTMIPVVGIQILDKDGNVKFQAVHHANYEFSDKPY